MEQDYILAVSAGETSLPDALQKFYDAFKDKTPGEFIWGGGVGVDNLSFGPVTITVDNVRVSTVYTKDYEEATDKNLKFTVIQGYAQAVFFDRFYASCVMVGKASTVNSGTVASIVAQLDMPKKDREALEIKRIEKAKIDPSFYTQIQNDPINEARNTNGIYIIEDPLSISYETVFQAVGIADFADNPALGLAIAVSANINTFTNAMTFTVGASMRLASSKRFTVSGEIGLLNGKLNSIGLSVKSKIPISAAVSITQLSCSVKGFQEPRLAVGLGGGLAIGTEVEVPKGLGTLQKALFPNKTSFVPLELSVRGEMNPAHNYFSLSGEGKLFGVISVSGSFAYDAGNIKAEVKAGLVNNSFLNGSLSAAFNMKQDNWNLRCNFNCSVSVDVWNLVGVSVKGELDVLLNSQDYTLASKRYNRKDLTVTVDGMATLKLIFSVSVSVQKTWVINLSNTPLASQNRLMSSISDGDMSALENVSDVLVCESRDVAENEILLLRGSNSGNVIESKSWQIDGQCSESGLVRIQVAAEYTLVDSNWRLTHSNGDTITVYTAENSAGVISVQNFTHNYYELLLDTPETGNWTLEILGDSQNSGGIYLDALQDEKFVTELEIIEQTDSVIKFRYSAITGATDDTTVVRLFAEEISTVPGYDPYSGIIAYLEETENGEFVWEIPEEFRHNAQYRFYISAASSNAGSLTESNEVEVFIARQNAELECSWELAYNADNTNTVTAYITITNTGAESTAFQWEILDYTNNDSIDVDNDYFGNTSDLAEVIASGSGLEIKGNSTVTIEQVITVTDELRDNPSSLVLAVTQGTENSDKLYDSEEDEICADDTDEIMFIAMESENCQKQTISWQAVDGADSYVLHYALEGDWEGCGVYVNNIQNTSYVLSIAPGEYSYRVMAIGSDGKAIGTWSEEQEVEVLFHEEHTLIIEGNSGSSRSQLFALNDGIYNLNGINLHNFTGIITLFRRDLVKTTENEDSVTVKQIDNNILTLTIINGVLKNPVSEILLDNGDYFWEWAQAEHVGAAAFDIKLELTGEVFSIEPKDREIISIGDDTVKMPLVSGVYVETLEGEVGSSNKDAIYQYMTDDGGELSLTIKSGAVFESDVKLNIYEQNSFDGEFSCVKILTVTAGEYTANTVILNHLSMKNNFYVQVLSPDNGNGEYNTDYSFDLSFDAFEDTVQAKDILVIDGETVSDWIGYRNEAHTYLLQIRENSSYSVRMKGDAYDAILKIYKINGDIVAEKQLDADGKAFIDDIYLESGNYFVAVNSYDKGEGQFNTDYVLNAYELKTLYPLIDNSDDTLESAASKDSISFDTNIENWLGVGDSADFFKLSLLPDKGMNSSVLLSVGMSTTQAIKDGYLTINVYNQFGQELEIDALSVGVWNIKTNLVDEEIYIGIQRDSAVETMDYSFTLSNAVCPINLSGNTEGVSWDAIPGISKYVVEYSQDNFENVLRLETASNKVDFFDLPAGVWQWRVKAVGEGLSNTEEIVAGGNFGAEKLISVSNGNMDMFFVNADGKWTVNYSAQHTGILNGWSGTNELVVLTEKNKLADIFVGSSDANILIMTDDVNGDALFLDDIYTALPGTVVEQQSRIAQIEEIRAGFGDDIVDMTSQQFAYVGGGVKIYGGLGNDTIWANNGNNTLFGDAGDDRIVGGENNDVIVGGSGNDSMHGGGGEDIFFFGENWGNDTVEQLADGEITLWLESGNMSNWDISTLTYTDGTNSIKVSGVSAVDITLKFGDDDSLRYEELAAAGCFADSVSEKIFEDNDKWMLA